MYMSIRLFLLIHGYLNLAEGHLHIKIETIFLETFWSIEAKHPPFRASVYSSPEPLGSQGELIGWP